MGSFEDFEPRMKKLERRLVDVWADIENLPLHAPLRKKRLKDYDRPRRKQSDEDFPMDISSVDEDIPF